MNKLGRKLSISISIAVIGIFIISILLTQYFLPLYYLHRTREKVEQVSNEIHGMNQASFTHSISRIENEYDITIVYEPIQGNVNLDEFNDTLRDALTRNRITLNKFWVTQATLQQVERGQIVNKLYDQGKLKSSFLEGVKYFV